MNIAFFTPYFGFGGLEKICLQTFKYFLDEGHNVYHFSTTYELEDRLNHENYHYLELPDNTRGESLQNELEINPYPVIQKERVIIFVGRLSFQDKRLDRLIDIWGHIYKNYQNGLLKYMEMVGIKINMKGRHVNMKDISLKIG